MRAAALIALAALVPALSFHSVPHDPSACVRPEDAVGERGVVVWGSAPQSPTQLQERVAAALAL